MLTHRFVTRGLEHYLAMRRWIERGEPGLAGCAAVKLVRAMRERPTAGTDSAT